ncbi:hypothetical protein GZ998_10730 [Actinomyces sp. 594]|uniref:hypothetical protein n=1 Tax=Actinomyces sp. 594 TaxID=2057793 RepID=UPI001C592104|nr:hypothetical protein [Actinomyces sp. 594]MBW3069970.1 hypothetical protein [Actinomyces sp. 594]
MRHKRLLAAAIGALALIVAAVVYVFWWPLPQGTPELAPEVEALRSQATSYVQQQPGRGDDWSLVLGATNTDAVWVHFIRGGEAVPDTRIDVGSSAEVLGCTITVLESHPKRPSGRGPGTASSSALIAVQCPDSATPTATTPAAPVATSTAPTAQAEPSGTAASAESASGFDGTTAP